MLAGCLPCSPHRGDPGRDPNASAMPSRRAPPRAARPDLAKEKCHEDIRIPDRTHNDHGAAAAYLMKRADATALIVLDGRRLTSCQKPGARAS